MSREFEKYVRKKLGRHSTDVDGEALWEQIYPHVKEEKKDKPVVLFLLLAIALGIAFISLSIFNREYSNNISKTTINEAHENININSKTETKTKITNHNGQIKKYEAQQKQNITQQTNTKKEQAILSKKGFGLVVDRPTTTISNKEINTTTTTTTKNDTEITQKGIWSLSPIIATLALREIEIGPRELALETNFVIVEEKEEEEDKATKPQSNKKWRVGVGVYGGIGSSNPNLSAKDALNDDYVNKRAKIEEQLASVNFGLDVVLLSKKNTYLKTGIAYTRTASALTKQITVVSSSLGVYNGPGTISQVSNFGTLVSSTFSTDNEESNANYSKTHRNYTHILDVPIMLGYQLGKDRWQIAVEAGIYTNILFNSRGEIPYHDGSVYQLNEDNESWHKESLGIRPSMGVSINYSLSQKMQMQLSSNYIFNETFTTNNAPFTEQHAIFGIRMGISRFF